MDNPPSSGVSGPSQSIPSHASESSPVKEPLKGKLDHHEVTALDSNKVGKKLPEPPKESRRAKIWKGFKDFVSIKSTPPRYQYNAN